jgi:putative NADH-flavin reductase
MRLVLFGAAGDVGERLVAEALGQGHEVTGFAHLGVPKVRHGRLQILTGDMRDPAVVEAALAGREAALWTPAGVWLPREDQVSEGVRTLTSAMERHGPRRLVFLSSLSVLECRRRASLVSALFLLRFFRVDEVRDAEAQERYVHESSLDWTIIRAGTLSDGPPTGRYRLGFGAADIPPDASISYADTAGFMLRQVTARDHLRATVGLFC